MRKLCEEKAEIVESHWAPRRGAPSVTHQAPRFPLVQEQGPKTNKTSSTASQRQCLIDLRPTRALGKFTTENVAIALRRNEAPVSSGLKIALPPPFPPARPRRPLFSLLFNSTRPSGRPEKSRRANSIGTPRRKEKERLPELFKVKPPFRSFTSVAPVYIQRFATRTKWSRSGDPKIAARSGSYRGRYTGIDRRIHRRVYLRV